MMFNDNQSFIFNDKFDNMTVTINGGVITVSVKPSLLIDETDTGVARNDWDPWYLLTTGLVAIVLVWVIIGELRFKEPATEPSVAGSAPAGD